MKYKSKNIFSLLLIIIHLILLGQEVFPQFQSIKFKHLSVQDGLSRSWVKCIYQDKLGFLWFGTSDGLNKYDGYTFKVYKHNSSQKNSLGHNDINVIYEDIKGNLLIVHGTADDNVHAQNTYEMTEKMVQAGVQFEMAMYTNRNHGIRGGNTSMHLYTKMVNFLKANLMEK